MVMQLLPASAAAFAPRAPPTIVLGSKPEQWLTQTLKRINKIKRSLNSATQHYKCLTETLGAETAIWNLASLLLPKAPEADLRKDDDPLVEAVNNYDMVHIEAYVVHVDMVSEHDVAFKLTKDTIDALVEYHHDIYSVDAAAAVFDWPEKEAQIKKLQDEFVQAANRFVFRTDIHALEGLEEDGAGELLRGASDDVKKAIMNLFAPLLAPPPRIVDGFHHAAAVPRSTSVGGYWQPSNMVSLQPPTMDSWRVLPSTPSPTATCSSDAHSQAWPTTSMAFDISHLPSPTPSYSQPAYTTAPSYNQSAYTSAPSFYSSPQAIASIPTMLYPSQLPHGCGSSMNGVSYDMYGFSYNNFAPQYATTI